MTKKGKTRSDKPALSDKIDPSRIVRAHALISGRVQGIFYRASARSEAIKRKLIGWVRNTSDGKVELIVQGPKHEVDDFLDWCRSGPMLADVTEVELTFEEPNDDLTGFEVKEYLAGMATAAKNAITEMIGQR
ncbi:MAG: acylphosphatase [Nanoarchaeota archaeon]